MDFAVIESGGKQYKVSPGQKIRIEKMGVGSGANASFGNVLLVAKDGEVKIGTPYVSGAVVNGLVLREARTDKKIVFRYHSKTRYRKFKTHRQHFTEVEIVSVH